MGEDCSGAIAADMYRRKREMKGQRGRLCEQTRRRERECDGIEGWRGCDLQ